MLAAKVGNTQHFKDACGAPFMDAYYQETNTTSIALARSTIRWSERYLQAGYPLLLGYEEPIAELPTI